MFNTIINEIKALFSLWKFFELRANRFNTKTSGSGISEYSFNGSKRVKLSI